MRMKNQEKMKLQQSQSKPSSTVPQKTGDKANKLKVRIADILVKNKKQILDQYYDAYCYYISERHRDERKRNVEYLKQVCMPVKSRFSIILDRFVRLLTAEPDDYDLRESEQDVSYALRFVVPGRHREWNSHDIIKMTASFVEIATSKVLDNIDQREYASSRNGIINIMDELIYLVFEDLWVSSVVGFRHQHRTIRGLLSKIMKTQEDERQRLAKELHDECLQILAVIPLRVQIVEEFSKKDIRLMRRELQGLTDLVNETIQEVRNLCFSLHSFWVEKKGLVFSLKTFIKRIERDFRTPVSLEINKEIGEELDGYTGVTLFRIIQEALYNAGKHSKARSAKVKIDIGGKDLLIVIEDDGVGFDPQQAFQDAPVLGHFGMISMQERTKLLGGRLKIDSRQSRGTQITISVPFN